MQLGPSAFFSGVLHEKKNAWLPVVSKYTSSLLFSFSLLCSDLRIRAVVVVVVVVVVDMVLYGISVSFVVVVVVV